SGRLRQARGLETARPVGDRGGGCAGRHTSRPVGASERARATIARNGDPDRESVRRLNGDADAHAEQLRHCAGPQAGSGNQGRAIHGNDDEGEGMTELSFKGKEFVYNHHLAVPFRPLVPDETKGIGPVALDGNLIIHGDNLHALKALLPTYAGKVKCIYIDPPYNTGTEGWCYNDRVNSPLIREWLKKSANPVDKEDLERHDKWLCMMWPRLQLLREFLSPDGVILVSIDDNEAHHLRCIM